MIIKIDTEAKVIELDRDVDLKELTDFLKSTIKDWKSYTVKAVRVESVPCYPDRVYRPYSPFYPWMEAAPYVGYLSSAGDPKEYATTGNEEYTWTSDYEEIWKK